MLSVVEAQKRLERKAGVQLPRIAYDGLQKIKHMRLLRRLKKSLLAKTKSS